MNIFLVIYVDVSSFFFFFFLSFFPFDLTSIGKNVFQDTLFFFCFDWLFIYLCTGVVNGDNFFFFW